MPNVGFLQTFGQSTTVWTDMQQSAFQQFEQENLKNKLKSSQDLVFFCNAWEIERRLVYLIY